MTPGYKDCPTCEERIPCAVMVCPYCNEEVVYGRVYVLNLCGKVLGVYTTLARAEDAAYRYSDSRQLTLIRPVIEKFTLDDEE